MSRFEQGCRRALLKRLQALLCVVPLLAGQTGALPSVLAIGATLEGSHTTFVGTNGSGFKVVLSHERGRPGRLDFVAQHQPTSPAHHRLTASVLCALGGSAQPLADHEGCFTVAAPAESAAREVGPGSQKSAGKVLSTLMPQISVTHFARCASDACRQDLFAVRAAVQELRTILLLI